MIGHLQGKKNLFAMFSVAWVAMQLVVWAQAPADNALADYVKASDATYAWSYREEYRLGSCDVIRLHMVSQTWKEIPWKHVVYIIKPDNVEKNSKSPGLLLVSGGSWKSEWPADGPKSLKLPGEANLLSGIAESLKSVVVIVSQVPFQPMMDGKHEDEIIAETFARFMKSGDPTWPLLLPMVKSAVRAMDSAEAVSKEKWGIELTQFTVTGASKRGWTTWLTSAVDERVKGLAPMVINMLNMEEHLDLQIASWGTYSEQIEDYTELELPRFINTERGKQLQKIVDPFQYRQKIEQPKVLIFGTNDRYWPLDACSLYWDSLTGSKHLLYVPNKGHDANDYPRVLGSILALHRSLNGGPALPKLTWTFSEDDAKVGLEIESDTKPELVRAWVATSETKDFRESTWEEKSIKRTEEKKFRFERSKPSRGYVAVFGEAVYPQEPLTANFSTGVQIFEASTEQGK